MRKLSYIATFAAAVALMAGCSKNQSVVAAVETDCADAPWASNSNIPVPIIFGENTDGQSLTTKSEIADMKNVEFGVFAADTASAASWTASDDGSNEAMLLYNRVAKGVVESGSDINTAQFIEASGNVIRNVTYYYPLQTVTKPNYTFYAYHITSEKLSREANPHAGYLDRDNRTFKVDVTLDSTDILWGKAEAKTLTVPEGYTGSNQNELKGFNTKYVRESRLRYPRTWRSKWAPKLSFQHLTTAFHINILTDPEDSEAPENLKNVKIQNMSVRGVYTKAVLDVVTGNLTPVGSRDSIAISLPAGGISPGSVPTSTQNASGYGPLEVGHGIFILPPEEAPTISFDIVMPRPSVNQTYTYPVTDKELKLPESGKFEAGKSYTFNIIIKSLEAIIINVDVAKWEEGFTADDKVAGNDIITEIG